MSNLTDRDDYEEWAGDDGFCHHCGGEGFILTCIDDLCHGQGYCMHGDGEEICPHCNGEG